MGPTLRVEPIGARVAPRCRAARSAAHQRGSSQTRLRSRKRDRSRAAHPRPVSHKKILCEFEMRFPAPKNTVRKITNKKFTESIKFLCNHQEKLSQYSDIEDFILRKEVYSTKTNIPEPILEACEFHLFRIIDTVLNELRERKFFLGVTVLNEVIFQHFCKEKIKNPVISALEAIRDSGVLHSGIVIYPLHSLGIIGGGFIHSYTDAKMEFYVPNMEIIISPQTNSFDHSLQFIKNAAFQLGVKKQIPVELIEHWHRSRPIKWLERNPLLIARLHSFPGSYYENQYFIANKLKIATIALLMLNSFQKFASHRAGTLLSSSRANNWETLDIHHYLVLHPKPHKQKLTGDCVPMNIRRPTLSELSEVPAELDPKFWRRRSKISKRIISMLLNFETGFYKYSFSNKKRNNHSRIYRKIFKSIEFYKRSYRIKDDQGEAILNLAVAFEILLTDNYSPGITQRILYRVKKLLKGVKGVRAFNKSIEGLFKCRGEYVHTGFVTNPIDISTCQIAYIHTLLQFSALLKHIKPRQEAPITRLIEKIG